MRYMHYAKRTRWEQPLAPVEHSRNHRTTNVSCQRTRIEAPLKNAACLAELVASRECKRVGDSEDKGNDCSHVSMNNPRRWARPFAQLTDQRQPDELKFDNRDNGQSHPECRLRIQREPEESLVRRANHLSARLIGLRRALEDPVRVARGCIDLVPPSQSHKSSASDVFEVVEVGCEQQDGDDEDEDEVLGEQEAEEVDQKARCCVMSAIDSSVSW